MGGESDVGDRGAFLLEDHREDVDVVLARGGERGDHVAKLVVLGLHLPVLGPVPHADEVLGADAYALRKTHG